MENRQRKGSLLTHFVDYYLCFFSITRVEQSEASLLQSREAFRPIARRAAVLFDVTRHMGEVNEKYTISLAQFLKIFDTAIQHSERYVTLLLVLVSTNYNLH